MDLRNDIKEKFQIFLECPECSTMYENRMEFCTTKNCNSSLLPTVMVNHRVEESFKLEKKSIIHFYEKSNNAEYPRIDKKPLGNAIFARVRDEHQVYTQGDMSVSEIRIVGFDSWYFGLKESGIDCENLADDIFDRYGNINDVYKTVFQLTMDTTNFAAAIFTASQYLLGYLHKNLATEDDSSDIFLTNNVILHITLSNNLGFNQEYYKFEKNIHLFTDQIRAAYKKLQETMGKWKKQNDIVLPVELVDNKLNIIEI